jgi:hypothetical protein
MIHDGDSMIGAIPSLPEPPRSVADQVAPPWLWGALSFVAGSAQFYHGYKRNGNSIGWGLLWSVAGLPTVAAAYVVGLDSEEAIFLASHAPPLGVAATQGYAQPIEKQKA